MIELLSRIATQAAKSLKSERPDFSTGFCRLVDQSLVKETGDKPCKVRAPKSRGSSRLALWLLRLWELMKSQGMQENQQVVFMSDGGENVRRVQEYLHPFSEHLIDWFHIIMECASLWNVSCSWRAHVPDYQVVLVDERSDFFP